MRPVEDRLRGHLAEGESIQSVTAGRLLEAGARGRAAIGLTERRFLCVDDAGDFVDVGYDYVSSIRRRRRTKIRVQSGNGPNRLLHLAAGLVGVLALIAGLVLSSTVPPFRAAAAVALAVVTVAVAVPTEVVRRRSSVGRSYDEIAVGVGGLALLGAIGTALVASSVSIPLYVLTTLGGLVLAGYAVRYRDEIEPRIEGLGLEREREAVIAITTIDGTTVRVAVDADSTFGRELGTWVHRRERDPAIAETPVVGTPSD